jgi:predicted CXXCH cytochrome family protein
MKKVLIGFIAIVSLLLVTYGSSYAISGACVNCHTMHNSQNGTRMADQDTPYGNLLRAGCISCHTGSTGATNSYTAPIVWHTTAPTGQGVAKTLAGGDFYWVADSGLNTDSMGHNVNGISTFDAAIAANLTNFVPPGWHFGATPGALNDGGITGAGTWTQQLNCAGTFGCHGVHNQTGDFPGMKGAHHANTGGTTTQANGPTTVGGSFRFLSGINGLENSQWNWGETTALHNEYYGINDTSARDQASTTYANERTISYLCAECHGYYHSRIDDAGQLGTPWLRHPTDIVLGRGAGTEYSAYNPDAAYVYSLEAPVARPTVPATSSATVLPNDSAGATGAIVMCLSCHRAHGSNQADLLRWDYTTMVAASGTGDTGCFTCHTTKNAD